MGTIALDYSKILVDNPTNFVYIYIVVDTIHISCLGAVGSASPW